jgi:uncharacterized oxidoreductase
MLIQSQHLQAVAVEILLTAGSSGDEARIVAENLIRANLAGHDSHGIGMLPRYIACVKTGELVPNQHAKIMIDEGPIISIEGGAGYGQVIGQEAMDVGIERAHALGVCALTIRHSFHLGRIGAWGERCAEAGLVSTHHVNAVGHAGNAAPYRGSDARYTTNPYCCTIPGAREAEPLVLDMATTVMAHGKVRVARNKGEQLPEGVLLDGQGQPTTDPDAMFSDPAGAIRPVGTYKGYGLALVNELLAGILSGGGTCRPETHHENDTILNNMLSVIIDPNRFVSPQYFQSELNSTVEHVTSSPPMSATEPVLIPGDPERATASTRQAEGIPIDGNSWQLVIDAAESVGLTNKQNTGLVQTAT